MDAFFTDDKFGRGTTIKSTEWDDEIKQMQEFVMNNPNAIFSYLPPDMKLTMLGREIKLDSGDEVDFVFVDEDGGFYLVETKLKKNTDKRRIFAQIDDYASSTWFQLKIEQDVDGFFSSCEHSLQKFLKNPSLELDDYLQNKFGVDSSIEELKNNIKEKIVSHDITFVIVMDELDEKIRTQIIYRIDQDIKTFGVELEKYSIDEKLLIVPKIFSVFPLSKGITGKDDWIQDDHHPELIWNRYENHVKTNQEFDTNLRSAILQLISKFDEWDADPWLHLSDMSVLVYFEKVKDYGYTPIKIRTDGSISLRPEAFNDDQKTLDEFRNNISNIDQDIKDKISAGGEIIRVPQKIWVPKVNQIIQVLEKFCK